MLLRFEQREIPPRQSFEEAGHLGFRDVVRSVGPQRGQRRFVAVDDLVAVRHRHLVVGVDEQPPQQLRLPRRQRVGSHRAEIRDRDQAQHLQLFFGAEQRAKGR